MAVWSAIEHGLGIIATSCCVLRPLFKRFYSSNTYDAHQVEEAQRRRSARQPSAASAHYSARLYGAKKDDIELYGLPPVLTPDSVIGGRGEWARKKGTGKESEEELTKGGVFVHQAAEPNGPEE